MDHIMVSINLGSKRSDWEISGTRLLSGQMMGDVTINIRGFFLPLCCGLQQVPFYSFYNT